MYCAVQEQLDVYFINWEKTFDRVPSSPNMAIQKKRIIEYFINQQRDCMGKHTQVRIGSEWSDMFQLKMGMH